MNFRCLRQMLRFLYRCVEGFHSGGRLDPQDRLPASVLGGCTHAADRVSVQTDIVATGAGETKTNKGRSPVMRTVRLAVAECSLAVAAVRIYIADALYRQALSVARRRSPDFIVGGADRPYLYRWWLVPRNRWFNVYLHQFLRDDDDRALHDHPWAWCSVLIRGAYIEHTIAAGGIQYRQQRNALSVKFSGPRRAHRIELLPEWWMESHFDAACDVYNHRPKARAACWTIFITVPRVRDWGFHCPERGWVPWQAFTAADDQGLIDAGCDGDEVSLQ